MLMAIEQTFENWLFGNHDYEKVHPKEMLACFYYACRFLALQLPSNLESIKQVFSRPYKAKKDADPHSLLMNFRDHLEIVHEVPYMIDKDHLDYFGSEPKESDNESLLLEEESKAYLKFIRFLKEMPPINGAIIASKCVAIAMRRLENDKVDFFDPHGANEITELKNAAYIYRCKLNDAEKYLSMRFPGDPEGGELSAPLTVWNLQLKTPLST